MRFTAITVLAATIATVRAFKGASPFVLFSSSHPSTSSPFSTDQIQSADDVLTSASSFLGTCASDVYIIVSQPEFAATDLSKSSISYLRSAIQDSSVQTKVIISEVVGLEGGLSADKLAQVVLQTCGAELVYAEGKVELVKGKKMVLMNTFDALSTEPKERKKQILMNDAILQNIMGAWTTGQEYTVIYTTSPIINRFEQANTYDPVFQEAVHMDLKRQVGGLAKNATIDRRPLFEKYQYFTPGLFMGLATTLVLLSILSVGVKALGSLQVSYGAFDKEMGPASQKK